MAELLHEFRNRPRKWRIFSYHPHRGGGANAMRSCTTATTNHRYATVICVASMPAVSTTTSLGYHAHVCPVLGRFFAAPTVGLDDVRAGGSPRPPSTKVTSGIHWNHPHEAAVRVITPGSRQAGKLLKERVASLILRHIPDPSLPRFSASTVHYCIGSASTCMTWGRRTMVGGSGGYWSRGGADRRAVGIYIRPSPAGTEGILEQSAFASKMKCLVTAGVSPRCSLAALEKTRRMPSNPWCGAHECAGHEWPGRRRIAALRISRHRGWRHVSGASPRGRVGRRLGLRSALVELFPHETTAQPQLRLRVAHRVVERQPSNPRDGRCFGRNVRSSATPIR